MGDLRENIKVYREKLGITKEELSLMMGKSKNVVSNWENGHNKINSSDVLHLCKALNIDANTLYGYDSDLDIVNAANKIAMEIKSDPIYRDIENTVLAMKPKDRKQLQRMINAMKDEV